MTAAVQTARDPLENAKPRENERPNWDYDAKGDCGIGVRQATYMDMFPAKPGGMGVVECMVGEICFYAEDGTVTSCRMWSKHTASRDPNGNRTRAQLRKRLQSLRRYRARTGRRWEVEREQERRARSKAKQQVAA